MTRSRAQDLATPWTWPAPRGGLRADAAVVVGLLTLIGLAFSQVGDLGFVNIDDPSYVSANALVLRGMTWRGAVWAFTTFDTGNWHPLTWLSLMADVELFGGGARVHHLSNLALHAANTLLVFALFEWMTGERWRSAIVAALFAVHPLHVESVAWVSERKDVLSAFFGLLSVGAYVRYTRHRAIRWYVLVSAGMVLSVASKPMLVTLPLVLLLLDGWPLARGETWRTLLLEKVPLLVISAASSAVTLVAQTRGGAVSSLEAVSFAERAANVVVAYEAYLAKTLWPVGLAAVYPHPAFTSHPTPPATVAACAALFAGVSIAVVCCRRGRPFLLFGWAWFVVTLVPVIGLVQVGAQAMADRYSYIPLIGLFVAMVWSLPDPSGRVARPSLAVACGAGALLLALAARAQTARWRDSRTLFEHTLAVTRDNATALRHLGMAYLEEQDSARGIAALRESLRITPRDGWGWMNLGIGLSLAGDQSGADEAFQQALRLRPDDADVLYNVGMFAVTQRNTEAARRILARLVAVNPVLADEFATRAGLR